MLCASSVVHLVFLLHYSGTSWQKMWMPNWRECLKIWKRLLNIWTHPVDQLTQLIRCVTYAECFISVCLSCALTENQQFLLYFSFSRSAKSSTLTWTPFSGWNKTLVGSSFAFCFYASVRLSVDICVWDLAEKYQWVFFHSSVLFQIRHGLFYS